MRMMRRATCSRKTLPDGNGSRCDIVSPRDGVNCVCEAGKAYRASIVPSSAYAGSEVNGLGGLWCGAREKIAE